MKWQVKFKKYIVAIILVLSLICALKFAWQTKTEIRENQDNRANNVVTVTAAPVVLREFRNEISAVGTLKARETVLLSTKVSGNVESVLVDIGDRVDARQVVIRLDRTNFALAVRQAKAALSAAEAIVAQTKARFEEAEKEYRRALNLLQEKVIPQNRFDAAEATYKTAREEFAAAKERRNQTEVALEITQKNLEDAEIRSPVTGFVVKRDVEVGQFVSPSEQVLRIVEQTLLKVDAHLPETDFDRVTVGTPAVVTVDAFPEEKFLGKVTVVNPMVKHETRTFRVRTEIPNPTGKLVDGMFARVRLSIEKRLALSIPRDALQRLPGSGTFYVFVVEENKALKRTIKVGTVGDQYAEVLDGLAEGEKVVTSGAGRLRSGIEVAVSQKTMKELKDTNKEERQ